MNSMVPHFPHLSPCPCPALVPYLCPPAAPPPLLLYSCLVLPVSVRQPICLPSSFYVSPPASVTMLLFTCISPYASLPLFPSPSLCPLPLSPPLYPLASFFIHLPAPFVQLMFPCVHHLSIHLSLPPSLKHPLSPASVQSLSPLPLSPCLSSSALIPCLCPVPRSTASASRPLSHASVPLPLIPCL
jgi:hypothetical protein